MSDGKQAMAPEGTSATPPQAAPVAPTAPGVTNLSLIHI